MPWVLILAVLICASSLTGLALRDIRLHGLSLGLALILAILLVTWPWSGLHR